MSGLPPWTADIEIDAALAKRLVASQFPQFAAAPFEPFGMGWDNAAYLAGGRTVFRLPRRRIAATLMEREIAVLPHLAPHLPLPISSPVFAGAPTPAYPWPFAGYDLIPGTTACGFELSSAVRDALAEPLARFLRAMHGIDPGPLRARGLPPDEIGRLDHAKRIALTRERLPALAAAGIAAAAPLAAWLEAHPPLAIDDRLCRVVHGDLYGRHVVLDGAHRPAGIIDWGDVHAGDPALDIAIAHLMLPRSAHGAFRAAYGPIDERTWEAARYRAIYHAVLEVDYGLRAPDPGMVRLGSVALELLAER